MDREQMKRLVLAAKNGDAHAYGELYETLRGDAYRFALSYLGSREDAEDAVQNTALKTFKSIASLKKPESFRSWFFRAEANECLSIIAGRKKYAVSIDEIPEQADDSEADMYLSAELNDAMRVLSDEDRMIVGLSVLSGFKSAEIAAITGLRPGSVRSRLSRALHTLRQTLENS